MIVADNHGKNFPSAMPITPRTTPKTRANAAPTSVSSSVATNPSHRAPLFAFNRPMIVRCAASSVLVPEPLVYLSSSFCIRPVFSIQVIPSLSFWSNSWFCPFLTPIATGWESTALVITFSFIPLRIPYRKTGSSSKVAAELPFWTSDHIVLSVL